MLTRRETTKLILGTAVAGALPLSAGAATRDEWAAAMGQALKSATVPNTHTELTLAAFGFGRKGGTAGMSAIVRMDWAPGFRTRRFVVRADGEQAAFKELVGQVVDTFRAANPDGVRGVRFKG